MSELVAYLENPFVQRALLGLVLVAINAGLAGAFAAFRNSTFLISGASHAALAGAALALVLADRLGLPLFSPAVGGTLFAVALALLAARATQRSSREQADTTIGVGFAFSMALAVLLISLIPESASRVWGLLLGDVLLLSVADLWLMGGMTVLLAVVFAACWQPFLFVTFDAEGAQAFGVRVGAYNMLLFALLGLSTGVLLRGVGAIVVFAMLAAPAATALLLGHSVWRTMLGSFLIALAAGLIALVVSCYVQVSVSGLAALLAAGSYFVTRGVLALRKAHR